MDCNKEDDEESSSEDMETQKIRKKIADQVKFSMMESDGEKKNKKNESEQYEQDVQF